MSDELNEYLDSLPVTVFKLITGETIIARIVEEPPEEELPFILSQPYSIDLETSRGVAQIGMHEWLFGCDATEVFIDQHNIITYHEATFKMKKFYSKVLIRNRLEEDDELIDDDDTEEDGKVTPNPFEFLQSLIDGLEPKDSTEDEDILSPWRDRMQWSPKSDTPIEDDDEEFPF